MGKTGNVKSKSGVKFPYRKLYDGDNNVVGGVNKKSICDAEGNTIADFSGVETAAGEAGKKAAKTKVYSSAMGEFKMASGGKVLLNGAPFGSVSNAWIIPLALLATLGIVVGSSAVGLAVTKPWLPASEHPVISISDANGKWEGTVDVLPDTIYPGGHGSHDFVIENPHDDPMIYRFSITETYNGEEVKDFPIMFRMLHDGKPATDYWYRSDELEQFTFTVPKGSTYNCGIEWSWQYEKGVDEQDTIYGQDAGKYSLDITITSEAKIR